MRKYWQISLSFKLVMATLAGFLMATVLFGKVAFAASKEITITPTTNSPVINPGDTYKGDFTVVNSGQSGYKTINYAAPYHVSSEDYTPEFTALPTAPNISSWFNFSSPGSTIKPGQSVKIQYTISVPENTQPGGYYAAIFAETQVGKNSKGIALNQRVGELFYIKVAGKVVESGSIASWQSKFFQSNPLTSTLRIKNDGSIHFPAKIKYNVKDILGNTKYQLNTTKVVLPQTIRKLDMIWDKAPALGLFKVDASVEYLGHTQYLKSKWVLVMSGAALWCIAIFIALLISSVLIVYMTRKRKKTKSYKKR